MVYWHFFNQDGLQDMNKGLLHKKVIFPSIAINIGRLDYPKLFWSLNFVLYQTALERLHPQDIFILETSMWWFEKLLTFKYVSYKKTLLSPTLAALIKHIRGRP